MVVKNARYPRILLLGFALGFTFLINDRLPDLTIKLMKKILIVLTLTLLSRKECCDIFCTEDDYISVNDLPIQDARRIRADESNITTANPIINNDLKTADKNWDWVPDAIRDIAYYLRSHKFNEYDRRYERNESTAKRNYYAQFPKPPLRNLHWEVHKHCQTSFLTCIEFLWGRVKTTDLKRSDDTAVIIEEQHWTKPNQSQQIEMVELECQKLKQRDNTLSNPFQGPLERYQWRTTASYFMCWYTMNKVQDLEHIYDDCNNFASCLEEPKINDYRANDNQPFACAFYSFCPDPCCGEKSIENPQTCFSSTTNPCYSINPPNQRNCTLDKHANVDFSGLVLNQFNVSCHCSEAGYIWNSKYGICVDIDECVALTHNCNKTMGQACLNTPGSFRCVCMWGYTWSKNVHQCVRSPVINLIKMDRIQPDLEVKKVRGKLSIVAYVKSLFTQNAATKLYESNIFPLICLSNFMCLYIINDKML